MINEPCKNCGTITNYIDLHSNDGRMSGRYCSHNCIDEYRSKLPKTPDEERYWWRKNKVEAPRQERAGKVAEAEPKPSQQDFDTQGLTKLFG